MRLLAHVADDAQEQEEIRNDMASPGLLTATKGITTEEYLYHAKQTGLMPFAGWLAVPGMEKVLNGATTWRPQPVSISHRVSMLKLGTF